MQRSISNNVRQLCHLASCLALAGAASNVAAATVQYSCVSTYASYIQSIPATTPTVHTFTTPAVAATPRLSMSGLPMLLLPPHPSVTPAPIAAPPTAPSAHWLAPTNKALPIAINKSSPQGLFYTPAELAFWKARSVSGPFKMDNDFAKGTPGDWRRIVQRADAMVSGSMKEPATSAGLPDFGTSGSNGTPTAGELALDTAFAYLITNDSRYLNVSKAWLLKTMSEPANDITKRCFVTQISDGVHPPTRVYTDGFLEAQWVNRTLMTYDFIKHSMTDAERMVVESTLLKWGYFFGAHMQWGLEQVFPNRAKGDYSPGTLIKSWAASDPFAKQLPYQNHACDAASLTTQSASTIRTFVDAGGNAGPSVSILSLFFNNRRSGEALSLGLIGLLVNEPRLVDEAKRYVGEWLAYSVWADGTQGEYQRNGDYCIAQQGLIYGAMNAAAAVTLADGMARRGDTSLYGLQVTSGMFGTQPAAGKTKSIMTPVKRHLDLLGGTTRAYYYERNLAVQNPRPATSLGNQESHFMNNVRPMDNYHDASYLLANRYYRQQSIHDVVMRVPQPNMTIPPFPGSTGNQPSGWSGATTIFPAMLFMFAEIPQSVWPYPFSPGSITYPQ